MTGVAARARPAASNRRDLMWLDRGAREHWHRGGLITGRVVLDEDDLTEADGMACYSGPCTPRLYARDLIERMEVTRGMRHGGPGGLASWVRAVSASAGYRLNDPPSWSAGHGWPYHAAACADTPGGGCACTA